MAIIKVPKQRIIYDNYDLWDNCSDDAKRFLQDWGNENPTDNEIWNEIYNIDLDNWESIKEEFKSFFSKFPNSCWIIRGYVERWNGRFSSGTVFHNYMEFERAIGKVSTDCDYLKFYDENGHLFFKCSHHDGTNLFEIRKVTDSGVEYLSRWDNSWDTKRGAGYVHQMIMKKYSTRPHFCHLMYGCPETEYIKEEQEYDKRNVG